MRSNFCNIGIGLIALVAASAHAAGAAGWPDAAAVNAARGRALDAFGQMPPAHAQAAPSLPAGPPLRGLPQQPAGIDVGEIAARYRDVAQPESLPKPARLIAFVSFAMPAESLKRLARDAHRAGAVLVLRGWAGESMRDTVRAVRGIIGDDARSGPAGISALRHRSPSHLRSRAPQGGQCGGFRRRFRRCDLGYALAAIVRERPAYGPLAGSFLRRLGTAD